MEQTAIDFLVKRLPMVNWEDPYYTELLEQAKEMFEKQIIKAHHNGDNPFFIDGKEYYNQTFNIKTP